MLLRVRARVVVGGETSTSCGVRRGGGRRGKGRKEGGGGGRGGGGREGEGKRGEGGRGRGRKAKRCWGATGECGCFFGFWGGCWLWGRACPPPRAPGGGGGGGGGGTERG